MTQKGGKRLIIGNWKMYVQSPDEARAFARALRRREKDLKGVEAALAPAFPLMLPLMQALGDSSVLVGAQTLSPFREGAHTGEVSAAMLKELGASFVMIGHSERRAAGESDEQVAQELRLAQDTGLRGVLCIGERERDDHGGHFEFLANQLSGALAHNPKWPSKLVIAYEPVWAIGKSASDAMQPLQLRETVIFIRKTLSEIFGREQSRRITILYGGSVEPENARALIEEGDVSGFLVGHASAKIDQFVEILLACSR
jgi:triosephosphate isomerase